MGKKPLYPLILVLTVLPGAAQAASCWVPPDVTAAQETREYQTRIRRLQRQQSDGSLSPEDYSTQRELLVQDHRDKIKSLDALKRTPPAGMPVCPGTGSPDGAPSAASAPGDAQPAGVPIGVSEGDFVPNSKLPTSVFHARELSFPGPQPTERWRRPEVKPVAPRPEPAVVIPKTDEGERPDEAPTPD